MHILLLEKNIGIGDEIVKKLSDMGNTVDWFTEGKAGKNALINKHYGAIILDLSLVADGMSIIKYYRDQGNNTPVLVLTTQDQQLAKLNPATEDRLSKPFELPSLITRLNSLLRKNKALNNAVVGSRLTKQLDAVTIKLNFNSPSLEYGSLK